MKKRVKVDVQMVSENFIAGKSNPAVVPLAVVILSHKIVFK